MDTSIRAAAVLGASTVSAVGAVIAALVGVGAIAFLLANLRSARPEIGSEIDLAPNRKPYLGDGELESTKLNRTLRWAFILLVIVAVGLPIYWLNEPGRQSGAVENYQDTFAARGKLRYEELSQCQNCHGPEGTGGVAPYTVLDGNQFVAQVQWRAPALNTVLVRFSREEVEYIINYGRPGSPMPGWGAAVNKGPLDEQQVKNLVDYLETIQLSPEEAQHQAEVELAVELGVLPESERENADAVAAAVAQIDYNDPETGRALFNLGQTTGFAGGSYSCGRCHTRGWSLVTEGMEPANADLTGVAGFPDGSGALGPNLTGGLVPRLFASVDDLAEFVSTGTADGERYGTNGVNIGSGKMPSFGDNPNTEEVEGDGMLTPDMIRAIAIYESSLAAAEPTTNAPEGGP